MLDDAFDPAEAADHVTAWRVVTADGAVAPAAPGSAVCSFTHTPVGADANAVPANISSHLFAKFVGDKPTAMTYSSSVSSACVTTASATMTKS
jgi:hypothetical protein